MERRQTRKGHYIGKRFHTEGTTRIGNIYGERTQKRRDFVWNESTWKENDQEKRLHSGSGGGATNYIGKVSVAPPTQGTWRINDYVSAVRLVECKLVVFIQ